MFLPSFVVTYLRCTKWEFISKLLGGNECKSTGTNTQTSGDVRDHVSRLKKNISGFHLCFNLHQLCASVAEAVSPHCKPFLLLSEDFQAGFYSQSKALIPQANSSRGHGVASAIRPFLGQMYQSGQILPEVPEKPLFVQISRANMRRLYGSRF